MTAEILALKLGLQLLWDRNMRRLYCEFDCSGLVKVLGGGNLFHVLASDLQDLHLLLCRSWEVHLRHKQES